jgi:hypothetical protein
MNGPEIIEIIVEVIGALGTLVSIYMAIDSKKIQKVVFSPC